MTSGDLNQDGILDLITVNDRQRTVSVLRGKDDGTFMEGAPLRVGGSPVDVVVADWDGDGDPDLGALDVEQARVTVLLNDGEGGFGDGTRVNLRYDFWTPLMVAADFDNNGLPDLAAAANGSGRYISVVLNMTEIDPPIRIVGDSNGDGVFDSLDFVTVFQLGEYEDGIPGNSTFEEGDWNGDGDFDSGDFVLAFQMGHYEAAATPLESQIAAALDLIFATGTNNAAKPRSFVA